MNQRITPSNKLRQQLSTFTSAAIVFVFLISYAGLINAQQALSEAQLRQARQASQSQQPDLSQYIQSSGPSTGRSSIAELPDEAYQVQMEIPLPPPYGSNIFNGNYVAERSDGLNDSYLVAPGDKISIQLWGAIQKAEVITVDNQGNIFVPDVGPVSVMNVPASRLNALVSRHIRKIYPKNVNVYVNLLTATPVGVYVAGPVIRPGQYAGLASDSILFYLNRAGGIDPTRGSYRKIEIMRDGASIFTYDIYDFLKEGNIPSFSFKDNDVVLVSEQGPSVSVEGSARYPLRFELKTGMRNGSDLMRYALPNVSVSHVAVTGNREQGPISVYMPISEFEDFQIFDGDTVLFNNDLRPQSISVQLSGRYEGPSFYTVKRDTRLVELLSYVEVEPENTNYQNVFIKRESAAEQQKQLIEEALQRLERSVFTAPASSDGEAVIRAQEAQLISQFIARARQIEPLGKVVVSDGKSVANIRLEQGDEIVIPAHTDLIQISGEVLMPQAFVYNPDAKLSDYIAWAGGFSERANDDRIVIVRVNGITNFASLNDDLSSIGGLVPGDKILVLPKVDTKVMQAVKDITQIMYQIAITANVALD